MVPCLMTPMHRIKFDINGKHVCNQQCCNFPVQTCSSSCGIIAIMFTAIVAFCPKEIWYYACSPQNKLYSFQPMLRAYHQPSTHSQYLRNVLASWLLNNRIDILNVVDKSIYHVTESLTLPLSIVQQGRSQRTCQISLSLGKKGL
jgi:hypothetical protein